MMAQQLTLNLGVIEPPKAITHDTYWDEITSDDNKDVGGQSLFHETPQTQNKFQIGSRVEMVSEFITEPQFGTVAGITDGRPFVKWEPYGGSYINPEYLKLAHQQTSTCKSVGEQVDNNTNNFAHQQIFTDKSVGGQVENNTKNPAHQHNGWIEKYSVTRGDNKYFYWRFSWREGGKEGGKKRRRYIGSTTSNKAIAKMEMVKSAIALGKLPCEIVEMLK